MQEMMQKVLNVNKIIYLFMFLMFINCGVKKISEQQKSEYSTEKFKTLDSLDSWITVKTYDNEISYGTLIPIIKINKLYFFDDGIETFNVEGSKHNIRISHIGKIPITIKDLVVKKGDSIVINAYLKDDPTPIVD